jgi:hypothetical protein
MSIGSDQPKSWHSFLEQAQEVDALRALNGHAKNAIPDQLGQGAKSTAHTESDGVVKRLLETIVVEEDTAGRVDVGIWVLGL